MSFPLAQPSLLKLREEYEHRCRECGVLPSVVSTWDDGLVILGAIIGDERSSPARSTYARTALAALRNFEHLDRLQTRQAKEHATLPVGYGPKVAGYTELLLRVFEAEGFVPAQPLYLDELPIHSFNGRALPASRGEGYLCMLDYGLFRLLHHVCLACYLITNSRSSGLEDKPYAQDDSLIPRAAANVAQLMKNYLQNGRQDLVMPEEDWLDDGGFLGASELSFAMKTFVVAHELAHVRLGHLSSDLRSLSPAERQEMEFAADAEAQRMLVRLTQLRITPIPVLGGGLAFLLVDLIRMRLHCELLHLRPEVISKSGDHPDPLHRIQRLDGILGDIFASHPEVTPELLAPVKLVQWIIQELTIPKSVHSG